MNALSIDENLLNFVNLIVIDEAEVSRESQLEKSRGDFLEGDVFY